MTISHEIYKFFADYIYKKSGMVYNQNDYYRLDSRLKQLMKIFELASIEEVYKLYQGSVTYDMEAVLINLSTNNETYFFRDVKPFKVLVEKTIPEFIDEYKLPKINIWSAAASTGQESYSILMSVLDKLGPSHFDKVQIEASDISTDALNKAKSGIYTGLDVQRGLPIATLMKHFDQLESEDWKIGPQFTPKVKFFEFNLLTGMFPREKYEIIFCRNVLIYQNKENKSDILQNIFYALKPGGYLYLGNGESLIGLSTDFERVTFEGLTIYKRPK